MYIKEKAAEYFRKTRLCDYVIEARKGDEQIKHVARPGRIYVIIDSNKFCQLKLIKRGGSSGIGRIDDVEITKASNKKVTRAGEGTSRTMKQLENFTMIESKEVLATLRQPTTENKAALVIRILEKDVKETWKNYRMGNDDNTEDNDIEARFEPNQFDLPRENLLLTRELELARRELELVRMEGRLRTGAEEPNAAPRINVKMVAELLNHFYGTSDTFEAWKRKIQLLRRSYNLDETSAKIAIGMRLRGKAASWLHSRPEYLNKSVDKLLAEIKTMLAHPRRKRETRKKCDERQWGRGVSFAEYIHEKIILANRIPIEEEELIDCVIDGIPDETLQDHAKLARFTSTTELQQAFEKVQLRSRS